MLDRHLNPLERKSTNSNAPPSDGPFCFALVFGCIYSFLGFPTAATVLDAEDIGIFPSSIYHASLASGFFRISSSGSKPVKIKGPSAFPFPS